VQLGLCARSPGIGAQLSPIGKMPASVSSSASVLSRADAAKLRAKKSTGRRCREDHQCDMCGVKGSDENEFKDSSPHAHFAHVVFVKGSEEFPKGNCLKCENTWMLGGFEAEFDTKEKFKEAREKDNGVQISFIECGKLWLAAHNAGRRCRPQSAKQRKRCGDNVVDHMQKVREVRKKITKKMSRSVKVKNPLKIMSVDRWKEVKKCEPEEKGLKPRWIGVPGEPGKKIWGVSFRVLPEGEWDAEDELADGVEEEEELDDGEDILREGQQDIVFNSAASAIGAHKTCPGQEMMVTATALVMMSRARMNLMTNRVVMRELLADPSSYACRQSQRRRLAKDFQRQMLARSLVHQPRGQPPRGVPLRGLQQHRRQQQHQQHKRWQLPPRGASRRSRSRTHRLRLLRLEATTRTRS